MTLGRHRVPRIRQRDERDCGPACLAAIAAYHGLHLPVARLRLEAGTDLRGTTVLGLVETAERLGFTAKGAKGGPDALARIPLPAIAHLVRPSGLQHFVVLCRVTTRQVRLMDPGSGHLRVPLEEFLRQWSGVLVLLLPAETFRPGDERRSSLRRFLQLVQPHRAVLAQALAGATAYSALGLGMAIYVQKVVDHVLVDHSRGLLHGMTLAMVGVLLLQAYFSAARALLVLRTGQRIDAALVLGYYRHLLALPARFFDTLRVGEIISRVNDAVKIRAFINETAVDLAVNVLILLLSAAVMCIYSPRLAALALLILPAYAGLFALAAAASRTRQRRLMESGAELESHLVESLGAAGTLRRLRLERPAELRAEVRLVRLLRAVRRSATLAIGTGTGAQLVSGLFVLLVLWRGGLLVLDGALTPGRLMSFYALCGYLTGPVIALIGACRGVQDALVAADRLFEIMDLERESGGGSIILGPGTATGVACRDVAFAYAPHLPVFRGLSVTFPPARISALVGESGCGKSTLAALVQRIYPLAGGCIEVGGADIRQVSDGSLRRVVGVVPQRIDLFSGTVAENIAAGDAAPDMRRVLELGRRLGLDAIVERLPGGYDARLAENGAALSGGERQRLAIARALYQEPDILFLDEATSALDAHAEALVREVAREYRDRGHTVIVIAHRLTTALDADLVVLLGDGRVLEQGTHLDLLGRDGAYARLWNAQMGPAVQGTTPGGRRLRIHAATDVSAPDGVPGAGG